MVIYSRKITESARFYQHPPNNEKGGVADQSSSVLLCFKLQQLFVKANRIAFELQDA